MKDVSKATTAYNEIRKRILSNQVVAGARLREDEWAKKLDVNRAAVREALTRLLGEQLVVPGEKGGYFVKSFTEENVTEIRELRKVLELGALEIAIVKISKEDLDELSKICDEFTAMVERGYYGGALEADMKFHETLIAASGNQKIAGIYHSSNIPLFHQKLGKIKSHLDDYLLTDQEHREILAAIRNADLEKAREALSRHLMRGEVYL